ncbi:uncharacterized protein FRV6_07253 [Fusarium oxysporum]|uniref:Uncharacterized protein n=1 Tax=Fusarium oxysporum TaxID=5507 RepID=A0A2H3TIY1_FUSOX|nr:uncharacterized protein FRV6_07253 [Fusarium oxysporum]
MSRSLVFMTPVKTLPGISTISSHESLASLVTVGP